jgi:heme a synthase
MLVENKQSRSIDLQRQVCWWLLIVVVMIFFMVIIGGITRLTGSGLSMVEWRPLMGTLPPMSQEEWARVFSLYQESPQYQQVNEWMTLGDFKWIFFWEYLHRLFGRLIGLIFTLPWLYFLIRGALKGTLLWRSTIALILGGSQGLLGWYMVKSGLVDQPHVSHFRLAAHLSLAFLCGQWVWSILVDLKIQDFLKNENQLNSDPQSNSSLGLMVSFLVVLIVQIIYGAFMAGSRAGYLYTTYPTMNGSWIAPTWYSEVGELSLPTLNNLLSNPDSIHFIHRTLAIIVMGVGGWLVWRCLQAGSSLIKRLGMLLGGVLAFQFLLGVLTVTSGMNLSIAASHQGGSFIVLTTTITLIQVSIRRGQRFDT